MNADIKANLKSAVSLKAMDQSSAAPTPFPSIIDARGTIQPDYSGIAARLDKYEGARFVTQFFYPVSHRTIERAPIRNVLVNGRRLRTPQDLAAYASAKLASAPPGWGGRSN